MRRFYLLCICCLIGCTNPKKQVVIESTFDTYINSLDIIPLPLKQSSLNPKFSNLSLAFDTIGFNKYKHIWTTKPLGVLLKNESHIVTVDLSNGDSGLIPFMVSFDRKGNKLDSLSPYKKSGSDEGFEATEYLIVKKDRSILVVDTVSNWKEDNGNIIPGSIKKTSDTTFYFLSKDGKFIKSKSKANKTVK